MKAAEIAAAYLEGRLPLLQAAVQLRSFIDPWQPIWIHTKGSAGPLVAIYVASDEADRIGFLGNNEEAWHPDVLDRKRAELAETEERLAQSFAAACHAIVDYVASQNDDR
ncbi:MAG: hypothetical protein AB1508_04985 [Pseudomonadota bacterium]